MPASLEVSCKWRANLAQGIPAAGPGAAERGGDHGGQLARVVHLLRRRHLRRRAQGRADPSPMTSASFRIFGPLPLTVSQ